MPKLSRIEFIRFIKKALYIWAGICFFSIGFVGIIFPILPGFLFMIVGMAFLAKGSKRVRRQGYVSRTLQNFRKHRKHQNSMIRKLASFF